MAAIDSELAARIRKDIFEGAYGEGERLSEAQLCETHTVSRTPVRLALRLLEREGVVRRGEGRGYVVQAITVDDIRQAVEVRGHLESLAARLMAEKQPSKDDLLSMAEAIDGIDRRIALGALNDETIREMHAWNVQFHSTIMHGCGNAYIAFTCERISHLPMLRVGSMVFDRQALKGESDFEQSHFRLRVGNAQHKVIYEAIKRGGREAVPRR